MNSFMSVSGTSHSKNIYCIWVVNFPHHQIDKKSCRKVCFFSLRIQSAATFTRLGKDSRGIASSPAFAVMSVWEKTFQPI